MSENHHIVEPDAYSRAIQCKQAAYTAILTKVGNGYGRHVDVHAWAENIANTWLPIQIYGVTSKGHNFNFKV